MAQQGETFGERQQNSGHSIMRFALLVTLEEEEVETIKGIPELSKHLCSDGETLIVSGYSEIIKTIAALDMHANTSEK